ncbi:MAG: pyridoxal kinase PdxY [Treponema sp.]|jgi:pyridoxine kinase|nr:pyridoxal kinase PdxY [Treponema sp.]
MAVLSIQSHVVYGYAGNTAAVFPLQRLGREVWAINTVEFSNHTGYGSWRGQILGAKLASVLVLGLEERGVLSRCEAVLSGYLGDSAVGRTILEVVKKIKQENPAALYCLDPVMGDVGRGLYVKPDIPGIFKNNLISLADIVTPNIFELETLSGITIKETNDCIKAINILHEMGPSIVLVTSLKEKPDELSMIASDKTNMYKITTPELPLGNGIAGTGDMTAAIFLSRFLETKNLEKTLSLCTASVFGILEISYNATTKDNNIPIELKIIEAQEQLTAPLQLFNTVKL